MQEGMLEFCYVCELFDLGVCNGCVFSTLFDVGNVEKLHHVLSTYCESLDMLKQKLISLPPCLRMTWIDLVPITSLIKTLPVFSGPCFPCWLVEPELMCLGCPLARLFHQGNVDIFEILLLSHGGDMSSFRSEFETDVNHDYIARKLNTLWSKGVETSLGKVKGKDTTAVMAGKAKGKDTIAGMAGESKGKDTTAGMVGEGKGKDTTAGMVGEGKGKDTTAGMFGKGKAKDTTVGIAGKGKGKDTTAGMAGKDKQIEVETVVEMTGTINGNEGNAAGKYPESSKGQGSRKGKGLLVEDAINPFNLEAQAAKIEMILNAVESATGDVGLLNDELKKPIFYLRKTADSKWGLFKHSKSSFDSAIAKTEDMLKTLKLAIASTKAFRTRIEWKNRADS